MSESIEPKGGSFLLEPLDSGRMATAEDITSEQQMIRDTAAKFVAKEIAPAMGKIEKLDYPVIRGLLKQAGDLGFLGISLPEAEGGLGLDRITALLVDEELGRGGSISVAFGAHTGIGTLPIYYYGNAAQRQKYLPKLISGEHIAAFALTEPDCGSDAFAAKTKAVLSADKKYYTLDGAKQFITNGALADIFVVFAKIGDQFSAFIVERAFPGVSTGPEEKKMGIKGSSTTPVIFTNARVPAENLLGSPGAGIKIALNILNNGRLKLSAGCLGAAKEALAQTLTYVGQRKQFNKTINQFGLIQEKLADMVLRIFEMESACFRTVGLIQRRVDALDPAAGEKEAEILKIIADLSIECAVMKVMGSEALDYVADEGLQCFGGYGYIEEYPMERAYRDSRINRIFEGTNEINRLVVTGMLLKKALTNELKVLDAVKAVQAEMTELGGRSETGSGLLAEEQAMLAGVKKAFLLVAGAAAQKFGKNIEDEQEVLRMLADCIIAIYGLESVIGRALKLAGSGANEKAARAATLASILAFSAGEKASLRLREAAACVLAGDDLKIVLSALRRFTKTVPGNFKESRRKIAQALIENGKYFF